MLDEWLAPSSLQEFLGDYLGRRPLARPGRAKPWVPYFDWRVLGRLLAVDPQPDVLVARDGRLVEVRAPRTLAESVRLMRAGFGIVVRKAEQHDAELAHLARAFAADVPGEIHIQLYVTPAGTQTFGWHFDEEDVFIVQTLGAKDYRFRENTVAPRACMGLRPDFGAIRREASPSYAAELLPGDWLYIPARWWHLVRSLEDSLSISIGVLPDATRGARAAPHESGAGAHLHEAERQKS